MRLGVIVGRFQVPELHDGHRKLIEKVKQDHDQVLVFLGCPKDVLGSKRNPLDFTTREKMLREVFPELLILPLYDQATDEQWSQDLDSYVKGICPIGTVRLYGGRDSFIPHYKGKYKTVEIELEFAPSGTDIRYVTANRVRVSTDFRAGIIYATSNQYRRVFPTVDMAIMEDGKILLGKKKNVDKFCLPGGFVDQTDGSYEAAAIREAKEETNVEVLNLQYVCSRASKDWRYRHPDDGTIFTTLFASHVFKGTPEAGDDLDSLAWLKIDENLVKKVIPTHQGLIEALVAKYPYLLLMENAQ